MRVRLGHRPTASYLGHAAESDLADYLSTRFATGATVTVVHPDPADERGFATFLEHSRRALPVERAAITVTHDTPSTPVTQRSSQPQA